MMSAWERWQRSRWYWVGYGLATVVLLALAVWSLHAAYSR